MSLSDPIADMLNRIRNALMAGHDSVQIPMSKVKIAIAKILKEEGYIEDFDVGQEEPQRMLRIRLRYAGKQQSILSGLRRVSKPGLRVYVQKSQIPRVYGGLGLAIISTPLGVMTGQEARRRQVGGEVLCYVW